MSVHSCSLRLLETVVMCRDATIAPRRSIQRTPFNPSVIHHPLSVVSRPGPATTSRCIARPLPSRRFEPKPQKKRHLAVCSTDAWAAATVTPRRGRSRRAAVNTSVLYGLRERRRTTHPRYGRSPDPRRGEEENRSYGPCLEGFLTNPGLARACPPKPPTTGWRFSCWRENTRTSTANTGCIPSS